MEHISRGQSPRNALLHPPAHQEGVPYTGRYSVEFDGEMIVVGSRDPETDIARALLARGITGKLAMLDANTGRQRSTIDIELAAKWRFEDGKRSLRRRKYLETVHSEPPAGETGLAA
jgi:hypothetical protein